MKHRVFVLKLSTGERIEVIAIGDETLSQFANKHIENHNWSVFPEFVVNWRHVAAIYTKEIEK